MRITGISVLFLAGLLFLPTVSAFAEKVVESELGKGKRVRFVNYRGRYTRIMPREEIRGIGGDLGSRATNDNRMYAGQNKMSLIAARGAGNKFNADLFVINQGADIVDIRAIRMIISAYLEKRYGYSEQDGMVLARFVSYYNAVYRGRMDYFRGVYNPEVTRRLTRQNAGLSRFYYDWPGKTRILIPLSKDGGKRSLTSVDTGRLSDRRVTGDLRKKKDRGVKDRRDLLDLRNRQNEERRLKLAQQKKAAADHKKEQDLRRRKLQEEKERQAKTKRDLDKRQDELRKKKSRLLKEKDPVKQRKLQEDVNKDEKKIKKLQEKKKKQDDTVKKQQQQVETGEKKVKQDTNEIRKREETIKKEDEKIKKDRKKVEKDAKELGIKKTPDQDRQELERRKRELARREKEVKEKQRRLQDKKIFDGTLYYLKISKVLAGGHYNNSMYLIDPLNRKVLLQSPFADICGRKYDIFSDGVVVIGHKGGHTFNHYLVLLDHKTLKPKASGSDNIYYRSFIEIRDSHIYAVYKVADGYRLGRFDASLARVAGSDVAVDRDSFISFYQGFLYINSPSKTILVLDSTTLKRVGGIAP